MDVEKSTSHESGAVEDDGADTATVCLNWAYTGQWGRFARPDTQPDLSLNSLNMPISMRIQLRCDGEYHAPTRSFEYSFT